MGVISAIRCQYLAYSTGWPEHNGASIGPEWRLSVVEIQAHGCPLQATVAEVHGP